MSSEMMSIDGQVVGAGEGVYINHHAEYPALPSSPVSSPESESTEGGVDLVADADTPAALEFPEGELLPPLSSSSSSSDSSDSSDGGVDVTVDDIPAWLVDAAFAQQYVHPYDREVSRFSWTSSEADSDSDISTAETLTEDDVEGGVAVEDDGESAAPAAPNQSVHSRSPSPSPLPPLTSPGLPSLLPPLSSPEDSDDIPPLTLPSPVMSSDSDSDSEVESSVADSNPYNDPNYVSEDDDEDDSDINSEDEEDSEDEDSEDEDSEDEQESEEDTEEEDQPTIRLPFQNQWEEQDFYDFFFGPGYSSSE